jgi:hypothetical protein
MNPSSRSPKMPAELSASTQQRLNMHAIAASAAGVGMLALTQAAEAKIVYTPTHKRITINSPGYLDLNHDGIRDFVLYHSYGHGTSTTNDVMRAGYDSGNSGNRVAATLSSKGYRNFARALRAGVSIGPTMKFPKRPGATMGELIIFNSKGTTQFSGRWANGGKGVMGRYLGLKFYIRGKVHYGWARLTVTVNRCCFSETLTGYAYETMPGKAILAGATKGPDDAEPSASLNPRTPEPATLGMLAVGAPGLSIWRREESVAATSDRS